MKKLFLYLIPVFSLSAFIQADEQQSVPKDIRIREEKLTFRVHNGLDNASETTIQMNPESNKVKNKVSTFNPADQQQGFPKEFLSRGEKLEFRVHYGFVNAGEATVQVHPEMYMVNNKVCYKATCFGRSIGTFEMITKIRDTWGTYLDTVDLLPQRSYRDITEGRHKLKEGVDFYHSKGLAEAEREKRGKTTKYSYNIPYGVQDIVSGVFQLRKMDFNKMKVGDTIKMNAFFEDQFYKFRIKYLGKSKVKTKFGTIEAIKLTPIMPENQMFDGESSIRVWLSDDKNKIPVKIEADMFVGAVEVDLKSYQGLKNPINFKKD